MNLNILSDLHVGHGAHSGRQIAAGAFASSTRRDEPTKGRTSSSARGAVRSREKSRWRAATFSRRRLHSRRVSHRIRIFGPNCGRVVCAAATISRRATASRALRSRAAIWMGRSKSIATCFATARTANGWRRSSRFMSCRSRVCSKRRATARPPSTNISAS